MKRRESSVERQTDAQEPKKVKKAKEAKEAAATHDTPGWDPLDLPLDRRVPNEVWGCIFKNLYPSQLCRLSLVNKHFYTIVTSMSLWSRMFTLTHGPKKRLRTLRGMPESKSYMLFMCANSLHVCEQCLGPLKFKETAPLPKAHWAPLPTLSTKDLHYVGEEINKRWSIKMCESCYSKRPRNWRDYGTSYLDDTTRQRLLWYRRQQ
ncbi:unnamed protein product [Mortierella alpina]